MVVILVHIKYHISNIVLIIVAKYHSRPNPNGTVASMRLPLSNKSLANLTGAVAKMRPTTSTVAKCDCPKRVSLSSQRREQTSFHSIFNKCSSKYISSGNVLQQMSNEQMARSSKCSRLFKQVARSPKCGRSFQTSGTVAKNVPNHTSFKPNCWGG